MSKRYLLDTNIISHMMRDANGIAAQHFIRVAQRSDAPDVCTSVVVQCELLFGLTRKPNPRLEMAYERVIQAVEVLPLGSEMAIYYASLRAELEAQGTPIGPNDTLIAAHALALDATLISGDAKFRRVPGLRVENWLAGISITRQASESPALAEAAKTLTALETENKENDTDFSPEPLVHAATFQGIQPKTKTPTTG